MNTRWLAILAVAGSLAASENVGGLEFRSTAVGLPPLQLAGEASILRRDGGFGRSLNSQPVTPAELLDRSTPASGAMLETFYFAPHFSDERVEDRRRPRRVYPASPTDLIGRRSDRDRLIEQFKARPAVTR